MRSRYAAFVRGRYDYLVKTLDPEKRCLDDLATLRAGAGRVRWTGLRVLDAVRGGEADADGEVEFVAFYEEAGRPGERHERSRFRREAGQWFYVDGEPPTTHPRPSRRDRCWCGGGSLYRKCHGA